MAKKIVNSKPSSSSSKRSKAIDEVELIERVRKLPALWNNRTGDYKNHTVKLNIWKNLAEEFNMEPEEIKDKWQSLKTGYRQALARASGSKGGRPWKHLKLMSFLKEAQDQIEPIKSLLSAG